VTTRPVGTLVRNAPSAAKGEHMPMWQANYGGETFSSSLLSDIWEWAEHRGITLMRIAS
jgi:hypothetical protein